MIVEAFDPFMFANDKAAGARTEAEYNEHSCSDNDFMWLPELTSVEEGSAALEVTGLVIYFLRDVAAGDELGTGYGFNTYWEEELDLRLPIEKVCPGKVVCYGWTVLNGYLHPLAG